MQTESAEGVTGSEEVNAEGASREHDCCRSTSGEAISKQTNVSATNDNLIRARVRCRLWQRVHDEQISVPDDRH